MLDVPSAWKGLECVIGDIIQQFGVSRNRAIEFGVEYGYSIVALSNFFNQVVGIDTFEGDQHTYDKGVVGLYEKVKKLMPYNVKLIQSSYQNYAGENDGRYDLAHIDIVHTYEDTYYCGLWALNHADVAIFHDTESFPDVKDAVTDLAKKFGIEFYNYPYHYGLGILCMKSQ